eukprot:CAMPEP_0174733722 /NCGR_PEP_ID=MMETSP1094-20130205/61900_1 /TAXON_ID=156173 /ORGANISM="Chrysochromulina brevifilum, Strain UTEX LB 985" /LENGTH=34 /DNA_ID= /DNA_START= /DNA_END= /DNA_ORIENTATION=
MTKQSGTKRAFHWQLPPDAVRVLVSDGKIAIVTA